MLFSKNTTSLFFVLTLLLVSIFINGCSGLEERKAKHLATGEKLYQQGDYEKASLEFKNVLKMDPTDVAGNYHLGLTLESLQKQRQAAGLFLRVIELNPNHKDAYIHMAKVYLGFFAADEAEKMVNKALALDNNDASAVAIHGAIMASKKNYEKALDEAQRAITLDKNNLDAISLMAALYVNDKTYDKAIGLLAEAVKVHKDKPDLYMLIASLYAKKEDFESAGATLQRIIDVEPKKLEYRVQLARFYASIKQPEKADNVLLEAVRQFPDNDDAKLAYADFVDQIHESNAAVAVLQKYVAQKPEAYPLQFALVRLYLKSNDKDKAKAQLSAIIKADRLGNNGLMARTQLADIHLRSNEDAAAATLVDEVLKENPQDSDALILHGSIAFRKKDYATSIADYRGALRNSPNLDNVLRLLAQAHYANKEMALAKENYVKAIASNPNDPTLYIELSQILFENNDKVKSLEVLKGAEQLAPKDIRVIDTMYKYYLAEKDSAGVLAMANKMKKLQPDKTDGYSAAATGYELQKRLDLSNSELREGLKRDPESATLISSLVHNLISLNQKQAAEKFLQDTLAKYPDNMVSHNLMGELQLAMNKYKDAENSFLKVEQLNHKWPLVYRNLAIIYNKQGRNEDMVHVYQRGIEKTGGNPLLVISLALIYEKQGKTDEAIKTFEQLLEKQPESAYARNNLAMILVTYKNDKPSLDKALSLVEPLKSTNDENILDTIGWVHYKRGEVKQAIPYLERAAKKYTDVPAVQYHYGMALYKAGDEQGAQIALQRATTDKADYQGVDEARQTLKQIRIN